MSRDDWTIPLSHGEPIRFGADGSKAVVRSGDGSLLIEDGVAADDPRVVIHDAHADNPAYAFALSRLSSLDSRYSPLGVFRFSYAMPLNDKRGDTDTRWGDEIEGFQFSIGQAF